MDQFQIPKHSYLSEIRYLGKEEDVSWPIKKGFIKATKQNSKQRRFSMQINKFLIQTSMSNLASKLGQIGPKWNKYGTF